MGERRGKGENEKRNRVGRVEELEQFRESERHKGEHKEQREQRGIRVDKDVSPTQLTD